MKNENTLKILLTPFVKCEECLNSTQLIITAIVENTIDDGFMGLPSGFCSLCGKRQLIARPWKLITKEVSIAQLNDYIKNTTLNPKQFHQTA